MLKKVVIASLACLFSSQAWGTVISTRADLNLQLGAGAITEDFESWTGDVIGAADFISLNSTTIVDGQGPGIVNSGLQFSSSFRPAPTNNRLQLDRRTSFSLPSGSLLAQGGKLFIDFTSPVTIAGFDFFGFKDLPDFAIVEVFDTVGLLLFVSPPAAEDPLFAVAAPATTFFGFESAGGIGRITIRGNSRPYSPLIDNLTYGNVTVIPLPAALPLYGTGLAVMGFLGWRRKRQALRG